MAVEKVPVTQVTAFLRQNVNIRRVRHAMGSVFCKPNQADLRKFLNDKTVPKGIRNHIYSFIRYRQNQAFERRTGREHPSVSAERHEYRRRERILERKLARGAREAQAAYEAQQRGSGLLNALATGLGLMVGRQGAQDGR